VSLKFPIVRPDNLEIIEPDDLNKNLSQFVDEINGNLTHDNLASDVVLVDDYFEDETFTQTFQNSLKTTSGWDTAPGPGGTNAFKCSKQTVGYTREDENGVKLPQIDFIAERDGYIIVDFMFSFSWKGSGLMTSEEVDLLVVDKCYPVKHADYYACCFPAESGSGSLPPGGWTGINGTSTGWEGEFGGKFEVALKHEGMTEGLLEFYDVADLHSANFPQGKWWTTPIDRFGMRARVLCNGVEVCESGWLYNGTDRNSAFISGVLPVRAGRNEIRSEVSAATLQSLYGASAGIRALDSANDTRGKFYPKAFYSSRNVASPLPKSYKYTIKQPDSQGKPRGDVAIDIGIDCRVHEANMIVQFRKA